MDRPRPLQDTNNKSSSHARRKVKAEGSFSYVFFSASGKLLASLEKVACDCSVKTPRLPLLSDSATLENTRNCFTLPRRDRMVTRAQLAKSQSVLKSHQSVGPSSLVGSL